MKSIDSEIYIKKKKQKKVQLKFPECQKCTSLFPVVPFMYFFSSIGINSSRTFLDERLAHILSGELLYILCFLLDRWFWGKMVAHQFCSFNVQYLAENRINRCNVVGVI